MGRHLAQGCESLRLQKLFLQLLALSQVPEKPHRGYLSSVPINKTGRKFAGICSPVCSGPCLIMDQAPRAPILRAIYLCPDLLGDPGRIEFELP